MIKGSHKTLTWSGIYKPTRGNVVYLQNFQLDQKQWTFVDRNQETEKNITTSNALNKMDPTPINPLIAFLIHPWSNSSNRKFIKMITNNKRKSSTQQKNKQANMFLRWSIKTQQRCQESETLNSSMFSANRKNVNRIPLKWKSLFCFALLLSLSPSV